MDRDWRPGTYEPFEPPAQPAPTAPVTPAGPTSPVPALPGTRDAYVIQVGAFSDPDVAEDLAFLLRRRYPDYAARVVREGGLYRVWVGGWPSREEAVSVLLIVRQRYPEAWIVAP